MMEDEMIYKEIYKNKNMWLTENEPLSCFSDGFRIKSAPFLEFLIPYRNEWLI